MEIGNCTQRLLQRIQKLEPENASKICGYLLLQHSLEKLMEYAMGSEEQIHSLITEAKSYLVSSPRLNSYDHLHPYVRRFSSPPSFRVPAPINLLANQHPQFIHNLDHISHKNEVWGTEEQLLPLSSAGFDPSINFYLPDGGVSLRSRSPLTCHYFNKGYCKHGQSCKFSHGHVGGDIVCQMPGIGSNEFTLDDTIFSPGSLERLGTEIAELLKERRGLPVSIASLPMMYQEMYGKTLQAEGYLTESQRHGKTGFGLTKLLAQLRNIRLMERPHGQHFVVLVEDAPKYMELRSEINDHGASSSHQIYLTFPAESTFTDADVQNYFDQFGPVHDVRIPRQEKRMFGFVSFFRPQTVRQILAAGHPHIICGARVLVKPYKEKSKLAERKYSDKLDAQMYQPYLPFDMDNGLSGRQRGSDLFELHRNQQFEDCRTSFEQQLDKMPDQFNSLFISSPKNVDDGKTWQMGSNCSDHDRLQIQLPDSPFASPRFGSINPYRVI
ncbi:Zinc finger CCCH domain-containing protein 18 [Platanthera zijinensis]|uniref:Zinc finger CCCH domain-containing protein 18 n=1 Tax=Platanthera zijinensis TaxID=2320716 RepID=A0AAP0BFQ5_9ASPA